MWALVVLQIGLEESGGVADLVLALVLMVFVFASIAALGRLFDWLMSY